MPNEVTYSLVLDNQGFAEVITQRIIGELKSIVFKLPSQSKVQGVRVVISLLDSGIGIFDEEIVKDDYYVLKVQPRDGFGQAWTMNCDNYFLFDKLVINAFGSEGNVVSCSLRWD